MLSFHHPVPICPPHYFLAFFAPVFLAGLFRALVFFTAFLAAVFLVTAFLAGPFLALDFFAAFLAVVFLPTLFFAVFFALAFFAAGLRIVFLAFWLERRRAGFASAARVSGVWPLGMSAAGAGSGLAGGR